MPEVYGDGMVAGARLSHKGQPGVLDDITQSFRENASSLYELAHVLEMSLDRIMGPRPQKLEPSNDAPVPPSSNMMQDLRRVSVDQRGVIQRIQEQVARLNEL